LLLNLEKEIRPVIRHFVLRPKPWEQGYAGDPKFSEIFCRWFQSSPWPDYAAAPKPVWIPPPVDVLFRHDLLAFLARQRFADAFLIANS
ncbi:MAG: hypothetical protein U1E67_22160, partial [Hyphomicrobiales bacterium]